MYIFGISLLPNCKTWLDLIIVVNIYESFSYCDCTFLGNHVYRFSLNISIIL